MNLIRAILRLFGLRDREFFAESAKNSSDAMGKVYSRDLPPPPKPPAPPTIQRSIYPDPVPETASQQPAPVTRPPASSNDGQRLSANFTLAELVRSDTAQRNGWDNTPDAAAIANLRALVTNVLQPIRDRFGPVRITSGYRNHRLNAAVGGSPTSQHRTGEAADFSVASAPQREVADWIVANLRFDQLILYSSGRFHISYSATRARKQVLRK